MYAIGPVPVRPPTVPYWITTSAPSVGVPLMVFVGAVPPAVRVTATAPRTPATLPVVMRQKTIGCPTLTRKRAASFTAGPDP